MRHGRVHELARLGVVVRVELAQQVLAVEGGPRLRGRDDDVGLVLSRRAHRSSRSAVQRAVSVNGPTFSMSFVALADRERLDPPDRVAARNSAAVLPPSLALAACRRCVARSASVARSARPARSANAPVGRRGRARAGDPIPSPPCSRAPERRREWRAGAVRSEVLCASLALVIEPAAMCLERTAFLRSCAAPTLPFGSLLTAYPVPPMATKRASVATIIAGDGRCFHRRDIRLLPFPPLSLRSDRCRNRPAESGDESGDAEGPCPRSRILKFRRGSPPSQRKALEMRLSVYADGCTPRTGNRSPSPRRGSRRSRPRRPRERRRASHAGCCCPVTTFRSGSNAGRPG